jgi:GDP-D-mannose 3',5'-epimerase
VACDRQGLNVFGRVGDASGVLVGVGFIETHQAQCMLSVLINTHLLIAARDANVNRFLPFSSACVYNPHRQVDTNVTALKKSDACSAMPEDGFADERHARDDDRRLPRARRLNASSGAQISRNHRNW